MKIIKNDLQSPLNIRTEKDYPVKGIEFIDITPLLLKQDTFKEITEKFTKDVENKNADYIVVPEARGFLLGSAVAYNLNIGCIPVRKKGKFPPTTVQCEFTYEKEYGKDTLALPKLVKDDYKGKNFYIIDDIYATGNTLGAISKAIEDQGGNVVGSGVIMNIKELNSNNSIYSIIDVNEE